MKDLTPRQAQVLRIIRQSIEANGYPPTLREIGAALGIHSTNGVNDHLLALERKGFLTREDMKSRSLRPVDRDAPEPLSLEERLVEAEDRFEAARDEFAAVLEEKLATVRAALRRVS